METGWNWRRLALWGSTIVLVVSAAFVAGQRRQTATASGSVSASSTLALRAENRPVPEASAPTEPMASTTIRVTGAASAYEVGVRLDPPQPPPVTAPHLSSSTCAPFEISAASLEGLFGALPAGIAGMDYPHAYPLPDGRVLWLFQDVFLGTDDVLADDSYVHNAGFVQDGSCVQLLAGPNGQSWIGGDLEQDAAHWFWPLDGEVAADGMLTMFFVEMRNPRGTYAAIGAVPVATWMARVSLPDLKLQSFAPAPDPSAKLYGWSVASDSEWSYLFGYCYRQFVPDAFLGADPSCSPDTMLARVPRGRFDVVPEYWDGRAFTEEASAAVPVMHRGVENPARIELVGSRWVGISKLDEWYSATLSVDVADHPWGPWRQESTMEFPSRCGDECNTYGACILPWSEPTSLLVAVSSNTWALDRAMADGSLYRPLVVELPLS